MTVRTNRGHRARAIHRGVARAACVALAAAAAAGALAAGTSPASRSAVASAAPPTADEQQMADDVVRMVRQALHIDAATPISNDTRAALEQMFSEHLQRFRGVALRWAREERPGPGDAALLATWTRRLRLRTANEIAAWRLLPSTPEHDDALMDAFLRPGVCQSPGDAHPVDFLAAAIDRVPAARRPAVLEAERGLLARWGALRSEDVPPAPRPGFRDEQRDAIERLRAGNVDGLAPMVPVLAHQVFQAKPAVTGPWGRCLANQWWLQSLRQQKPSVDPEAMRQAWRQTQVFDAMAWETLPLVAGQGGSPDYPYTAAAWGVEGRVTVSVEVDAQGRFVRGSVLRRDLHVDGLRPGADLRYLASSLDEASLAKARAAWQPSAPGSASAPRAPGEPRTLVLNWRLQ